MAGPSVHNLGDDPDEGWPARRARGGNTEPKSSFRRGGGVMKDDDEKEEHEEHKAGGRTRLAKGGRSSVSEEGSSDRRKATNLYNAAGSPAMESATNETPGFRKGGATAPKVRLRAGGNAMGALGSGRMDRVRRQAGGRTPYSSGSELQAPTDDRPGRGYEGGKAA